MDQDDYFLPLELKGIERIERILNKIFNRMSFSIVLLAVSIIISGIVIGSGLSANTGTEMYILNISVLRTALVLVGLIVIGLLISILRSNRF